ncbi:hypothetical protein [Wolbachia endosymbiont of Ctenocephalides felis wCfeT]|uniref:hypothetical protein n=1 Tax=Wolbachia endosymbiont of Ctenocephalides felis wCfeT TaxID=2732593 RepID=UPI001447EE36|nr:hypothetical protein [Wolbachia endosymbiont of Ctenocephalides felis wCfeT]
MHKYQNSNLNDKLTDEEREFLRNRGLAKTYNIFNIANGDIHSNFTLVPKENKKYIVAPFDCMHEIKFEYILQYFEKLKYNLYFHLFLHVKERDRFGSFDDYFRMMKGIIPLSTYFRDVFDAESFPFTTKEFLFDGKNYKVLVNDSITRNFERIIALMLVHRTLECAFEHRDKTYDVKFTRDANYLLSLSFSSRDERDEFAGDLKEFVKVFGLDIRPHISLKESRSGYCVCIKDTVVDCAQLLQILKGALLNASSACFRGTKVSRKFETNRVLELLSNRMGEVIDSKVKLYHASRKEWAGRRDSDEKEFLVPYVSEYDQSRPLTALEIKDINKGFRTETHFLDIISKSERNSYVFYDDRGNEVQPICMNSTQPMTINLTDPFVLSLIYENTMYGLSCAVNPKSGFINREPLSVLKNPRVEQRSNTVQPDFPMFEFETKEESSCVLL